jgi:hypothetical protein
MCLCKWKLVKEIMRYGVLELQVKWNLSEETDARWAEKHVTAMCQ